MRERERENIQSKTKVTMLEWPISVEVCKYVKSITTLLDMSIDIIYLCINLKCTSVLHFCKSSHLVSLRFYVFPISTSSHTRTYVAQF